MLGLKPLQMPIKMITRIIAMHMIKKGKTSQRKKSVQKQRYLMNNFSI